MISESVSPALLSFSAASLRSFFDKGLFCGAYAVPFVLVNGPNPPYPERMPYATNELNSNENAPAEDPGIFTKTEVNR